jgi:exonuclease III
MKQTRPRFLTWNPGGMAQGKLVEIRQWLQQHPHDVVVLPETRWGFERCWSDDKWHYVHSHTGQHRVGGILVMIARHLIDSEHIGFDVVLPGRILHIRLHFLSSAIDIMAVYQFADSTSTTQQQYRQQFWEKLDNHIYTLPSRNQMICCGDFNCALAADPPWTGTGTFRWKHQQHCGHQHRDMPRFHQLLHRHSLTAANACSAAIGPSYFHTDYAARIDFFLIRMHSCDGATKSSYYLHEAEFLPINQTHHFPLVCTIPKVHMQFHKQQYKPACNYRQRSQCRQASLQETEEWLQLSRNVAASCLRRLMQADPKDDCISELHQELIPTFHELFQVRLQPSPIQTQTQSSLFCTTNGITESVCAYIVMPLGRIQSANVSRCGITGDSFDRGSVISKDMPGGLVFADFKPCVKKRKRQLRHTMHMPCFRSSIVTLRNAR